MAYQALYRKYRPESFENVIGQEHITKVLKNQVKTGHTSHAYLFSGTRGTGKTSTAKILARAVNCLHPKDGEPCMECEACLTPQEANVDVYELDAASNNGVDDMRSLIEKAVFSPVKMKKKVYIIDEAHMLSAAAFNALLKTLEEPPSHVMFILATTEPHKIIPTITSRCQRFDFRRLKTSDIINRLETVLTDTGVNIDKEALSVIARKANGGMRDALSLADQIISFCGNDITADSVYHILGSADFDSIYNLAEILISDDARSAINELNLLLTGRDISVLIQDITSHFRALLLCKVCGDCADILDCTDDDMLRLAEQSQRADEQRLIRALDILTDAQTQLKYFPQPRIMIETAFVKICRPEYETDMRATLDRINILENKLRDGVVQKPIERTIVESKTDKQPKKKKIVSREAFDVYKEICSSLPLKVEKIGDFLRSFFIQATEVKLIEKDLHVVFSCETYYEDARTYKNSFNEVAADLGYDVNIVPEFKTVSDDESLEKSLLESFGDDLEIIG